MFIIILACKPLYRFVAKQIAKVFCACACRLNRNEEDDENEERVIVCEHVD
jgi:hypothetical protein